MKLWHQILKLVYTCSSACTAETLRVEFDWVQAILCKRQLTLVTLAIIFPAFCEHNRGIRLTFSLSRSTLFLRRDLPFFFCHRSQKLFFDGKYDRISSAWLLPYFRSIPFSTFSKTLICCIQVVSVRNEVDDKMSKNRVFFYFTVQQMKVLLFAHFVTDFLRPFNYSLSRLQIDFFEFQFSSCLSSCNILLIEFLLLYCYFLVSFFFAKTRPLSGNVVVLPPGIFLFFRILGKGLLKLKFTNKKCCKYSFYVIQDEDCRLLSMCVSESSATAWITSGMSSRITEMKSHSSYAY